MGTIILAAIAAYAVYKAHEFHTELVARNESHMSMAMRYGQFQYYVAELADSTLDLGPLVEEGNEYCDGYQHAFDNVQEALQQILEQDGQRNLQAYYEECGHDC